MTNADYKATPEQWAFLRDCAANGPTPLRDQSAAQNSCILELEARVDALEEAENDRRFEQAKAIIDKPAPAPAGSLVERLSEVWNAGVRLRPYAARAALREVVAWLMDQYTDADDCIPSEIGPVISRLREEAGHG
jgi:hypothetical protein